MTGAAESALLSVQQGVQFLRRGQVIAYPTEAVYGLGCDPRNPSAVQSILELKARDPGAGFILVADHFEQLKPYLAPVDHHILEPALASWPGPVTWLIQKAQDIPEWLSGKHETIAVRVSAHPVCRALCTELRSPLVSTSANPAAREPARSAEQVSGYFGQRIAGIVEGELGDSPGPTEIRDLASGRVIRPGKV